MSRTQTTMILGPNKSLFHKNGYQSERTNAYHGNNGLMVSIDKGKDLNALMGLSGSLFQKLRAGGFFWLRKHTHACFHFNDTSSPCTTHAFSGIPLVYTLVRPGLQGHPVAFNAELDSTVHFAESFLFCKSPLMLFQSA